MARADRLATRARKASGVLASRPEDAAQSDRQRRVRAPLWLAHNRPADLTGRCLLIPTGRGRSLALCARCLAVYPAMIATLALQMSFRWGPIGEADWWIVIAGAAPGLLHWGIGRLDHGLARGTALAMAARMLTGALLGVAVGRALLLYFMDPQSEIFWVLAFVLLCGAVVFEAVARMKLA